MKSSKMTLFVLLIALPVAKARADSYDPAWGMIPPTRTLRVVAETSASDTQNGKTWNLERNLTSMLPHQKYQKVQFVSESMKSRAQDLVLFYGWAEQNEPGTAC